MAVDGKSSDIQKNQIEKIKELFPEVFSEGKVDFAKLKATLGEHVDMSERYTLSWKGKKDVFSAIQERTTKTLKPVREESVDYDTTENLFIEGDNLEVLKVLQDSYYGKVKMIYIDPPYNTGNDFVYNDKFAEKRAEYEEAQNGTRSDGLMKNTKDKGHYHSNWLNMMYPRLFVARNLLRKDGVIFISIDDNEVHNLRLIMNEIFGEENFVAQIVWKRGGGRQDSEHFAVITEYIVCFARNKDNLVVGEESKEGGVFPKYDEKTGKKYKTQLLRKWGSNSRREDRPNLYYSIKAPDGSDVFPKTGAGDGRWRWALPRMLKEINEGRVEFVKKDGDWIAYEKVFEDDSQTKKYTTIFDDISSANGTKQLKSLMEGDVFDFPKPVDLAKRLISLSDEAAHGIIMDFFSGSGTVAHAVMQLNAEDSGNRKHIQVQLPELTDEKSEAYKAGYKTIADIAKERICRAGKKVLEDNKDKLKERKNPLDVGFKVLRLDDSNFKAWNTDIHDEEQLKEQMQIHLDPIVDGASEEDLLLELMLKSGYRPTDKIEKKEEFYLVENTDVGKTAISFTREMTEDLFAKILATKPTKILLLDRSLSSSSLKTNLLLQAKHASIDLEVV